MSRRFNGTSDLITFTVSTPLQTLTAGDVTFVAVVDMNDVTDGAFMHFRASGGPDSVWMESSTGAWNFGQGVAARTVGAIAAADGWEVLAARKIAGGANAPTGRRIVLGGATTQVTASSALADGAAPGAAGAFQVGKWGTAAEFLSADVAALAIFKSVLSDATIDGFTTYAAILAAAPAWIVRFDQAAATDPIADGSGNGGGSITITGTTIVADPPGFFGAGGAAPAGLSVPVAVGSPTVALNLSAAPSGIAVPAGVGPPTVALGQTAAPTGIAAGVAPGTPTSTIPAAAPAGVALAAAPGTPTVALGLAATPTGVAVSVALGQPSAVSSTPAPVGVAVTVTLGLPTVALNLSAAPAGIAVPAASGQPGTAYTATVAPSGIAVPVAAGNPASGADRPPGVLAASGSTPTLTPAGRPATASTAAGTAPTLTATGTP